MEASLQPASSVEPISLPTPPLVYAAVLVLYRNHKDAPVHAVGAEVWQGDRQVLNLPPVHCMGMRGNQVTAYIQTVLEQLHQQFGVSRFEDVIKQLPVLECPIQPCPLKEGGGDREEEGGRRTMKSAS